MISPHHNQQLFSDYYLNVTLEHREDWMSLTGDYEVEVVKKKITTLFKRYKPSDKEKEAQTEEKFIKPVLKILGHTFAVQASLATPCKAQTPDYIFYRDQDAQEANNRVSFVWSDSGRGRSCRERPSLDTLSVSMLYCHHSF